MIRLFLLFVFISAFFSQAQGIWVTRFALKKPSITSQLIQFVDKNKITDVFIQIRGRGDAFYQSEIEQNDINSQYETNLSSLINQLKARKVKVHAWINVFLMASSNEQLQKEKKHILNKNKHWIDYSTSLTRISRHDSVEGLYTTPASSGLLNYYISIVNEITHKFKFDGIHLDYFRKASLKHGYHPKMRQLFHSETGNYAENLVSHERKKFNESLFKKWNSFLSERYTEFLTRLVKNGPKVVWSVAVKPNPQIAKENFAQDWQSWLQKNLVDFVIPMNYNPEDSTFYSNISSYNKNLKNKIWLGIATYNQSLNQMSNRIKYAKKNNYNVTIFSFNDLNEKSIHQIF